MTKVTSKKWSNAHSLPVLNVFYAVSASKQASKHYYLLTQVGLWQLFKAGVDLRLGCPQSDILERMSLGIHLPTPRGWTAELAGGCGKQFRQLGSNPGLPRPNPAP